MWFSLVKNYQNKYNRKNNQEPHWTVSFAKGIKRHDYTFFVSRRGGPVLRPIRWISFEHLLEWSPIVCLENLGRKPQNGCPSKPFVPHALDSSPFLLREYR